MRNHRYENELPPLRGFLFIQIKLIQFHIYFTRTRFETQAQELSNSEILPAAGYQNCPVIYSKGN